MEVGVRGWGQKTGDGRQKKEDRRQEKEHRRWRTWEEDARNSESQITRETGAEKG
jgi:hypothetical protein